MRLQHWTRQKSLTLVSTSANLHLMSRCLSFEQHHQQQDKALQTIVKKELEQHPNGTKYTTKEVEGVYLIHENNKIIVPPILQERVMEWYHTILVHPGKKRMEESIRSIYT